jgi:hypothetical protein
MQTQMQLQQITDHHVPYVDTTPRWNYATRIGFRFSFVYFVLYTFVYFTKYVPFADNFLKERYLAFWYALVPLVGKNILRLNDIPITKSTGSGDTTFVYLQLFTYLLIASLVTLIWSALDRRRLSYPKLYEWLKFIVRLWLACLMIRYGLYKAVPVQMVPPWLVKLVQPYGDFSPMGLLWNFMGSSTAYTIITGCVEVSGGLLLILPRTMLLGALVSLVAMSQVFILNMCYDVPVKLLSFHMVLGALFLLAPQLRRLADVFVFNRRVEPVSGLRLFNRKKLNVGALIFQLVFGAYVVEVNLKEVISEYKYYYLAPTPPLFGIYTVEEYWVNGKSRPPLLTDETRWKRVIFDQGNHLYIEPMIGANRDYIVQVDSEKKTLTLTNRKDSDWKAELSFVELEPGQIVIEGQLDDQQSKARLVRADESKFPLLSQGFRWVYDPPSNR